jgi:hypothetical protein
MDAATMIGMGLGGALWIFIVIAVVCCFVKLYPRDPRVTETQTEGNNEEQKKMSKQLAIEDERLFMSSHETDTKYVEIKFGSQKILWNEVAQISSPNP